MERLKTDGGGKNVDLTQEPHCDGIKHGGEIPVSGFLDKMDLIAVEVVKIDLVQLIPWVCPVDSRPEDVVAFVEDMGSKLQATWKQNTTIRSK